MHTVWHRWDTDFFIVICASSVFFARREQNKRILFDLIVKKNGVPYRWTGQKQTGGKPGTRKSTLCGRPKGVRYQIRTTVDFSGPLAVSLFLSSHNGIVPFFFRNHFIMRSLAFWHRWTQMGSDAHGLDTDIFMFYYLCLIRVNPRPSVVPRGERLRLIIDCM